MTCRLVTVRLDEAPTFWAVSYLWGSEEKPMSLNLTNSFGQDLGYILLTQNCASAIEALLPMGVRYLWIDAICINQSDVLEKQLQIR
jgi:Heterokaryon incompatibility protein (HET)